ncbi:FeoB-associated Cys-rich membrane protein [Clostridioides difficile]
MEILITALLVIAAGYILFRNIKKSSKGNCNCGSCSSQCPKYKK